MMSKLHKFIINVHPPVLKNSKQIIMAGGRPRIIPSKAYQKVASGAIESLRLQWPVRPPINQPVNTAIKFCGPWYSHMNNYPDLSNLYGGPEDWLEAAGILENDRQIESHNGSRREYLCDTCDYGTNSYGRLRRNSKCPGVKACPHKRIEIELTVLF